MPSIPAGAESPPTASTRELTPSTAKLPRTGLWVSGLDAHPTGQVAEWAAELEHLGHGALWLSEGVVHDPFITADRLLAATRSLVVGTGIAVVWGRHPHWARISVRALLDAHPDRFVLGLGTSHARVVEDILQLDFHKPLAFLRSYLDQLDAPDEMRSLLGLPEQGQLSRFLAALGPRAIELARDRADGAITYLVPPEHTAQTRASLGADRTLVVEQAVVVGTDPEQAMSRARQHLAGYLHTGPYRDSWQRLGFTEKDFEDGGSDRLVSSMVAIGQEQVAERTAAHLAAGADHVCLQALPAEPLKIPIDQWRLLGDL